LTNHSQRNKKANWHGSHFSPYSVFCFSAAVELSNYQVPRQCQTNKRPHTCPSFQVILCKFFFLYFSQNRSRILQSMELQSLSIFVSRVNEDKWLYVVKWRQPHLLYSMLFAPDVSGMFPRIRTKIFFSLYQL
jgi:hypothetical protein